MLATIPSRGLALLYVLVFGAGSVLGMASMTAALGMPLALAVERATRAAVVVRAVAGLVSVGVGAALIWSIGMAGAANV